MFFKEKWDYLDKWMLFKLWYKHSYRVKSKVSYCCSTGGLTSRMMYSWASRDVADSRVPEVALVRTSSWMLVRLELPPPLSWKRTTLPESKENSGMAEGGGTYQCLKDELVCVSFKLTLIIFFTDWKHNMSTTGGSCLSHTVWPVCS